MKKEPWTRQRACSVFENNSVSVKVRREVGHVGYHSSQLYGLWFLCVHVSVYFWPGRCGWWRTPCAAAARPGCPAAGVHCWLRHWSGRPRWPGTGWYRLWSPPELSSCPGPEHEKGLKGGGEKKKDGRGTQLLLISHNIGIHLRAPYSGQVLWWIRANRAA